jgi:hypothetical protein
MTERSHSRRAILKSGVGALAVGAATGLAGCSAIPGVGGGGGNGGSARIENWAFAAGEVGEFDDLSTNYVDLRAVREYESTLPDEVVERYDTVFEEEYAEPIGLEWEGVDWYASVNLPIVLATDHEVAAVVERLTGEQRYEERGEVDGYSILVEPNGRWGYAVDGSRVLWTRQRSTEPADALATVIGTQRGETDMAVDENEDFVAALDAVSGDSVSTSPGVESLNVAARASSWTLRSDTSTSTLVWVYEDQSSVDEDELRNDGPFDADDLSVDGRTVTWSWEFDTETFGRGDG